MCELTAIFLALNWIQDFKPLNTVIFVDSLSALQAIKGSIYKVKNYIIYDIYNICTSLSKIGINVILEWIPSHVGILGNELADKEAKNSLSLKNKYVFNPLYKQDIKKNYFKRYVGGGGGGEWDSNLKGRHLYGINKTVSFSITAPKLYRYNEILFFRLRTGYIKLNSYLNKIGFNSSNMIYATLVNRKKQWNISSYIVSNITHTDKL